MAELTRRSLIGGAAAAGAAAVTEGTVPSVTSAATRPARRSARVVVVGAGFAGLSAARELVRKGVRDVVVLIDGAVQSGERAAAEVLAAL